VTTTSAAERPPPEASERFITGWHVAFWLIWALAVIASFGWSGTDVIGPRPATLALLAVIGCAYLFLAQPAARRRDGWRGRAYLVVLLGCLTALFVASPGLSFLLFIAYPQMWYLTDSRRQGVGFTIALSVTAATAFAIRGGTWQAAGLSAVALGVSLLFSLLLGLWISGIIDQSTDRARLIAELESTRADLARAHHAAGVVAERERMAREIHDTIAQGLTSTVMLAQVAARHLAADRPNRAADGIAAIEDTARHSLADARALVASYAAVGVDAGLPAALRRLGERFTTETGIRVDVVVDPSVAAPDDVAGRAAAGGGPATIARAREVVLLRSVQEGLANVRKHSAATHVTITLTPARTVG
jgi:signal transduction histidine kinase